MDIVNKQELLEHLDFLVDQNLYINNRLTKEQRIKLVDYVLLIQKWNKVYNLTSINNTKEMLSKHILDSLVIAEHIEKHIDFIDIGTGAGLPGIPLAIIFPDKQAYLLDVLNKRIVFLSVVKSNLKLTNVNLIKSRVEDFHDRTFSCIISRAFTNIGNMLKLCNHLSNNDTEFCALKGLIDTTEHLEIDNNKYNLENIIKLTIPGLINNKRHLLKYKKVV